jgi:hypothetical protein
LPVFKKLTDREIQELNRRRNNLEDLKEYVSYLSSLRPGDWGAIDLSDDDSQRTVKRRTSIAATSQGKNIRWRRSPAEKRLVFQVMPS